MADPPEVRVRPWLWVGGAVLALVLLRAVLGFMRSMVGIGIWLVIITAIVLYFIARTDD